LQELTILEIIMEADMEENGILKL
ncbi:MAG: hypothetical protein Q612_NSC00331G0014, partial [Negativicoccus succinicivorans DORA_17_25]